MTFSGGNRGGGGAGFFWRWVTNLHYEGLDGIMKFAVQFMVAGAVVVAIKGFKGQWCGNTFKLWVPQTWASVPACWAGGMADTVPSDFLNPGDIQEGAAASGKTQIVSPPSPNAQQNGRQPQSPAANNQAAP